MTRTEFARRLHEAALRTLAYARELIVNDVPDEYRFDIRIAYLLPLVIMLGTSAFLFRRRSG